LKPRKEIIKPQTYQKDLAQANKTKQNEKKILEKKVIVESSSDSDEVKETSKFSIGIIKYSFLKLKRKLFLLKRPFRRNLSVRKKPKRVKVRWK